jgi:hypothetical protein
LDEERNLVSGAPFLQQYKSIFPIQGITNNDGRTFSVGDTNTPGFPISIEQGA